MPNFIENINPCQECEWGRARIVLMHEPGIETLFGVISPHSSNFLEGFSIEKAVKEHRRYREELEGHGIKVYDIIDLVSLDSSSAKSYNDIKKYILETLEVEFQDDINNEERVKTLKMIRDYLLEAGEEEIIDLLLLRPKLIVSYNEDALDNTTKYRVRYEIDPIHNLLYMRDSMITTAKGITIGRYRLAIRRRENSLVELLLRSRGIRIVHKIVDGYLEGGDFLPAKDFILQGVGLLSNMEGCMDAIRNKVYGDVEVGLVIDPNPHMDEMHLDGYIGLLSDDLAMVSITRLNNENEPDVMIYTPHNGGEEFTYRGKVKLSKYLEEWGFDIIQVPLEDHLNLAENFLLIEKMTFIGVSKVSERFRSRLEELGVKAIYLEMNNLLKGYGGPHCLTQVILRDKC